MRRAPPTPTAHSTWPRDGGKTDVVHDHFAIEAKLLDEMSCESILSDRNGMEVVQVARWEVTDIKRCSQGIRAGFSRCPMTGKSEPL